MLFAAAPLAAAGYDGRWRVEFDTQVGACERSFGWPLEIVNGSVVPKDGVDASGFIAREGLASLTIRRGQDIFRAQGRVKGQTGSGAWSSSTALCGGRWKLIRR